MTSPRKRKMAAAVSQAVRPQHDHDYSGLLSGVRASFAEAIDGHSAVFETDAKGLYELYLDSLPAERQVHTCHCCRRFIEAYGGLVTIDEAGGTAPIMWNPHLVPIFYHGAFSVMAARVKRARVTSVFHTKEAVWGVASTGKWSHPSVVPPAVFVYRERALTAGQAMAAAKENFRTVANALTEFTVPMLDQALRLLEGDTLARSEKFVGPVKWLRVLQDRPKGKRGESMLWRAIAAAPEGFCHPKASVIGPLLDDIAAGFSFSDIKARFNAKMAPLQYQRPQAPPSVGNIKAAEALAEKLGIQPSLERRFARFDDLAVTTWLPRPPGRSVGAGGPVFGHLMAKSDPPVRPVNMPETVMTWDKFVRTVLHGAEQMELYAPSNGRFIALTTAVHADAPPVLKWDREEARNPVAWYVYPHGSPAASWGLRPGWVKVNAVTPFPNLWGQHPMTFLSDGAILILDGAADTRNTSNALFPECLKEELHGVRSTIEAYSRSATLSGREQASACGYDIRKSSADCTLRVLANGGWSTYKIDRWD